MAFFRLWYEDEMGAVPYLEVDVVSDLLGEMYSDVPCSSSIHMHRSDDRYLAI